MTALTSLLAATSPTTPSASKSAGSNLTLLIVLVGFAGFYFLVLRPRQQKARKARAEVSQVEVGDTVMSVGGIKGVVVDADDTDVRVEVAPGVILTFVRRAITLQKPSDVSSASTGEHDASDGHDPEDRPGTGTEGR